MSVLNNNIQKHELLRNCHCLKSCCGNEHIPFFSRNRRDVGRDAPIFRRLAYLDINRVYFPDGLSLDDFNDKSIKPFETVNNCRSCGLSDRQAVRTDYFNLKYPKSFSAHLFTLQKKPII